MIQIVWFKRDLRISDHEPLARAADRGPVLPLYIVEPGLWQQPDMSLRHWAFVSDSLQSLRNALAVLGQPLIIRHGDAVEVLCVLLKQHRISAVWSHQETGNNWTFRRDQAIAELLKAHGIPWIQPRQHGVVRGRLNRNQWSQLWERLMTAAPFSAPSRLLPIEGVNSGEIPDCPTDNLAPDVCPSIQPGGRLKAEQTLNTFLNKRGVNYHLNMSSPLTADTSCSRLSTHLSWGTLSMREVLQTTRRRRTEVKHASSIERGSWSRALAAFEGRLHWHCHFIQKLESEPRIEFENLHPALNGLRENDFNQGHFEAWTRGECGIPFVDACMRFLQANGWINFRMRAMLMAFSSYHLWLHWRKPALHLARLFVDYEPGIHYPQVQMQSGTTGINTLRIYNPVKQSKDQDPRGEFIRTWIPELNGIDTQWIHTPWLMPASLQRKYGARIGQDYPRPIVDHETSARRARQLIQKARRGTEAREQSREIFDRHGSRKRQPRRVRGKLQRPDLITDGA